MNLNELATEIHEANVAIGWWDNDPCIFTKLQLVSTEIAEATEGERKDLMDDKLPHRKMGEVELADALIRVLDLGGRLGLTVDDEIYQAFHYSTSYHIVTFTVGHKHLIINTAVTDLYDAIQKETDVVNAYTALLAAIVAVSDSLGYDIESAMTEKRAFNATRADHKRENRAEPGGKAF